MRLLDAVLERQCQAVEEGSQTVVIEVRPQGVVNIAHDADAQAVGLQTPCYGCASGGPLQFPLQGGYLVTRASVGTGSSLPSVIVSVGVPKRSVARQVGPMLY